MERPRVFLAWSGHLEGKAALTKALDIVGQRLAERGFDVYNWNEQPHNRNINKEIEEQLRGSDLVILEGTTDRPNPAFEVGFSRYPDLPIIVLKQEGSEDLPADFGAPRYLEYPRDVGQESRFATFADELVALLDRLERETFSPGHRRVRRSLSELVTSILTSANHYTADHPHLYMIGGWLDALGDTLRSGGPTMLTADSDQYLRMFAALQDLEGLTFRALADLTDNTEAFWEFEHPEPLITRGSERIFIVNWRVFFERDHELAANLDSWREQLAANPEYSIYVVTDSDLDPSALHPVGRDVVGKHLLLIQPGRAFGGYRFKANRDVGRWFQMETDAYRFGHAERYYESVKARAVRIEPGFDIHDVKRAWLRRHRIGEWSPDWTRKTERRAKSYFSRYDQHIRCWIPGYSAFIDESAAMVAREIVRVREQVNRPVRLLEIGYGTGSLTARVEPWITQQGEPFLRFGHLPPVEYYHAIDRADQMRVRAAGRLNVGSSRHEVKLLRQIAWDEVRSDVAYDIIFGSLSAHFLIGEAETGRALDDFFENCALRLSESGTLIFADSFPQTSPQSRDRMRVQWRDWMIDEGLSVEAADAFLDGNADMLQAPSVSELADAARRHGFQLNEVRFPTPLQIFSVTSFHRLPGTRARPALGADL